MAVQHSTDPAIIEGDRRLRADYAAMDAIDLLIRMLRDIHGGEQCSPAERRTIHKQLRLSEDLMEKAGWFAKKPPDHSGDPPSPDPKPLRPGAYRALFLESMSRQRELDVKRALKAAKAKVAASAAAAAPEGSSRTARNDSGVRKTP
jgi:hypothetical protein